jgi:hypothetical protein
LIIPTVPIIEHDIATKVQIAKLVELVTGPVIHPDRQQHLEPQAGQRLEVKAIIQQTEQHNEECQDKELVVQQVCGKKEEGRQQQGDEHRHPANQRRRLGVLLAQVGVIDQCQPGCQPYQNKRGEE